MNNNILRSYSRNASIVEGRTVSGYAIRFDEESQNLGFYETIARGAVTEDTIKNSDIFARMDHRDDVVLARSRYGEGSLSLELREDGLFYSFEAPNTIWGDELLEHIRRGEISTSSFAFSLPDTKECQRWYKDENGRLCRTIYQISALYDVSPVFEPAYLTTSCSARSKEAEDALNEIEAREEEQKQAEEETKKVEILSKLDERMKEFYKKINIYEMKRNSLEIADRKSQLIHRNLDILSKAKEEVRELTSEEEEEMKANEDEISELDEEQKELDEELEKEPEKEEKSNTNISGLKTMEKKNFSIAEEIRNSMKTHEPIVLRSTMTVAAEGEDVVATDVYDVWEPLRANNVLVNAGMRVYSGLVGDVQIPLYSKGNVAWKGETATADDGNGSFTNVTLSPKRITGKFPISLQFLAQTTPDVEACIRKDIALAVMEKIESTVLGSAAGTSTQPAGLAYNVTATTISNYAALTGVEADIESYNYPNINFIASPHFKGAMKAMEINDHGMVYNDGRIDEYPTEVTSNVASSYAFVGDFSNLALGLWDEVRIDTVADSATLSDGQIMIIVNAFADAKLVRDNAVKYVKA